MRQKQLRRKSEWKSYKSVAQRYDNFPLISDIGDVLEEPFCYPPLQKSIIFSFSVQLYISSRPAGDQYEKLERSC